MRTILLVGACLAALECLSAPPDGWRHSGEVTILTTPDGADLPEGARVRGFPLLVRLHGDSFPFAEARLDGTNAQAGSTMAIKTPARMWFGGWYDTYDFVGDLDEVRVSRVVRSPEWARLEYENQKPLQSLVGPVVLPGDGLALSAEAGGARKIAWSVIRDGVEEVVAVDRFSCTFDAGRVAGDAAATLRFRAVCPGGVKMRDIPVTIREAIPEPAFTLEAPATWDGRTAIDVVPRIANLPAMEALEVGEIGAEWEAGPFAVVSEPASGGLRLLHAFKSGRVTVTATLSNGGPAVTRSAAWAGSPARFRVSRGSARRS